MSEVQTLSGTVLAASFPSDQAKYDEREDELLKAISQSLDYYRVEIEATGKWHRRLSVATMIMSVLAPVFVAGSASGSLLYIAPALLAPVGVSLTIGIAVLEGFKRIYKFNERWSSAYTAKLAIKRARETYKFNRIGLTVGAEDWKKNFHFLEAAYEAATNAQTRDFFTTLQPSKIEH